MLNGEDRLPLRPTRVIIAGVTGVGKTMLSVRLADLWSLHHVEIDALHHGERWTPRPEFEQDVRDFSERDGWVTEWQYSAVRPLLADRAQLMVWLDLPRRVARTRLLRRTLSRRIRRTVLWNGNMEPPLHTFFTDPDVNILRWEMKTHARLRETLPELERTAPHLVVVRLRSQREVGGWLDGPARCALA